MNIVVVANINSECVIKNYSGSFICEKVCCRSCVYSIKSNLGTKTKGVFSSDMILLN